MKRERSNNVYSLSAYFFSASCVHLASSSLRMSTLQLSNTQILCVVFVDLPTQIAMPLLQLAFLYWMVPLYESASAFFVAVVILFVLFQVSSALGYMISVVSPNLTVAVASSADM